MGIVPDRFIRLKCSTESEAEAVRTLISAKESDPIEAKSLIKQTLEQEQQCASEVNCTFGNHVYYFDVEGKENTDIINDLARMLKVRFRSNAPRRPPNVVLVGAPGSGRTTQSEIIAAQFGLVCVSPEALVKDECKANPGIKEGVLASLKSTGELPEDLVMRCVDQRLKQSDCRINGWILDGFPQTGA
jgi:adenylate kinase